MPGLRAVGCGAQRTECTKCGMSIAEALEGTSSPDSISESPLLTFRNLDASSVADFKLLNQTAFPVKYSDTFYQECRSAGHWTQLAFSEVKLLGAIACRLEPQSDGSTALYIMSLAVQTAYRGQRIALTGSRLLDRILKTAEHDQTISDVYLHVHVSNEDAINFYRKWGFEKGGIAENYYRRLKPPHAVILSRRLRQ